MAGKKKVTLAEFHAWLEGVEEMHDVDWCPDSNQWKVIRNKIKTIIETVATIPTPIPTPNNFPNARILPAGIPPAPEIPSGIPSGPIEKLSPEAQSLLTGNADGKHTTPVSEYGDDSPFS